MDRLKSDIMYEEMQKYMPGGGSAGGRRNRVTGRPLYLEKASGSRIYDVDGNEYIDYHCSAGAAPFGYNHPRLKAAAEEALEKGFFVHFDTEYTLEFAKLFTKLVPTVEQIRFNNSGTEATQAAIRLARGYTGKKLVIRFDGHFHGMHESIWYNHGSFPEMDEYGEVKEIVPDSAGIPGEYGELVKVIRFNDIHAVEHAVEKYAGQIAAIILEPISYNCGCYEGDRLFMQQLREICTREGIVLIFDEVISGLRFRPGSAQTYYGIKPDLSTFAKAIGGSFSLALFGGKAEIMQMLNPDGPVCCGGTTAGAQLALVPGIECLKMVMEPEFYDKIDLLADTLYAGIDDLFAKHSIKGHVHGKGAQFGMYFGYDDPTIDANLRASIKLYDMEMGKKFIAESINEGLYFHYFGNAPYPPHCGFGIQHSLEDINETLERMDKVFKKLK